MAKLQLMVKTRFTHRSLAPIALGILPILMATPLIAQTSLLNAFAACEASVLNGSDDSLQAIGTVISNNERGSRIRVDTPQGTVLAVFLPPTRQVSACMLIGRHPELAVEFQNQWQDWVEWEEASAASEAWFNNVLKIPESVDLTDHSQPGFVVARCNVMADGLILSSQPAVANTIRQVLPTPKTNLATVIHFQFSAVEALPGRCLRAIKEAN